MLNDYDENDLPIYIAVGINDDVVSCVCGANVKFELQNDEKAKYTLTVTKEESDYNGNYKDDSPRKKDEL